MLLARQGVTLERYLVSEEGLPQELGGFLIVRGGRWVRGEEFRGGYSNAPNSSTDRPASRAIPPMVIALTGL